MSPDTELLFRYHDGEMSHSEAAAFRLRLADSPALRLRLLELRRLGVLVRDWSSPREALGAQLIEPTLRRIAAAERRRARLATAVYAMAGVALAALPWLRQPLPTASSLAPRPDQNGGAAIERVEVTPERAQVFVLGRAATPVVWLVDDALDGSDSPAPDPG